MRQLLLALAMVVPSGESFPLLSAQQRMPAGAGVDSLPAGWSRFGPAEEAWMREIRLDRTVRHGGTAALRLHTDSAGPVVALQQVDATGWHGRRLRLSGYVRVAGAASGTLTLRIEGAAAGTPWDGMGNRPLRDTTDWNRLEIVLDVPGDATRIVFGPMLLGPGTLWVDDLELATVDSTVAVTSRAMLPAGQAVPLSSERQPVPRNLDFEGLVVAVARPVPEFERTTAAVLMRDGVRLATVILKPAGAKEPLPILLTRTPYGAAPDGRRARQGYIVVDQDIRGTGRSQGEFVMNRPTRLPNDATAVDETTDAWDTVDWLVKYVVGNNGRVGVTGVSYPGWLAEVVLLDPHPAVRAVSPQAPMTDTWLGDDFFHQGAFRLEFGAGYAQGMEGRTTGVGRMPGDSIRDTYARFLAWPSLRALTDSGRLLQLPTWRRFVEHPAYDSVWQRRAFQRLVTRLPVPTLTVGGWWDQEDLFGPQSTYAALERFDTAGVNALIIGPWSHGQWSGGGGATLGNLRFGSATADSFLVAEAAWFDWWLKDRGDGRFPGAMLFDAGTGQWRRFDRWPLPEATVRRLYFGESGHLSFTPPSGASEAFDEYRSDPADPVPYQARPTGRDWSRWMTEDQRFLAGRADVVSWRTAPLENDLTIAGDIVARLFASTTGSDADWVVKLIDVFPDSVADRHEMAGYQLMVAGDIMRGRYRRSWEHPEPIPPGAVEPYTVDLHQQYYTFRKGHRIMVQVQSSWFPVYDRNPQTWVPNIFEAPASAYQTQTHRIFRTAPGPSHVELMVLPR